MAEIVLVHGAFNELWGPNELQSRWLPALRDGLWHHGTDVAEGQVGVCFYGDLFRLPPSAADDAHYQQSRAGVAEMLSKLAAASDGGGPMAALGQAASSAAFDRTVDMVTTMTTRPDLQERIWERFDAVVSHDTKVVVAHSLGTVISYNNLARRSELSPDLVTLGSPLGTEQIASMLTPPPVDGQGRWPGGVRRWTNIAAVGDHAVGDGTLAGRFGPGPDGRDVVDHPVDNGHRAHDPEPYLNAAVTGAAVAAALEA